MKNSFFILIASLLSNLVIAGTELPECKNRRGDVVPTTTDYLESVMKSREKKPQVFVTGTVEKVLPEDKAGLPHQKYTITVNNNIRLTIVSNLDFGRVPLRTGDTVSVCGEFLNVGSGMVHWTHFDPHGGHPNGFTIKDGQLYGEEETPM